MQWGEVPCEDRNGEITGYVVEYSSTSPSHSGTLTVSGADTGTAVLGGLLPSTTYTIAVRAQGAPTTASISGNRATTRPTGQSSLFLHLYIMYMHFFFCTEIGFFHAGNLLPLNSIVLLSDIGLDSEALFCLTDNSACCTNNRGAWRFPSGTDVSRNSGSSDFYFSRGSGFLRLNRRSGITEPTGIFMCVVPTASSSAALPHYVGVYSSADEGECLD